MYMTSYPIGGRGRGGRGGGPPGPPPGDRHPYNGEPHCTDTTNSPPARAAPQLPKQIACQLEIGTTIARRSWHAGCLRSKTRAMLFPCTVVGGLHAFADRAKRVPAFKPELVTRQVVTGLLQVVARWPSNSNLW